MQPANFKEANSSWGKPAGTTDEQVGSLPVHKGVDTGEGWPVSTSCWQPSSEEEKQEFINNGCKVFLRVFGSGHPVVSLTAHNPVEHGWTK